MKLLVVDNYDSFTYNLVYVLRQQNVDTTVLRNDKVTLEQALEFDGIILSPGPGIPEEAGNMPAIIEQCAGKIPMLGICLGHQAIAEYLGAGLVNNPHVFHGVQTPIKQLDTGCALFADISGSFEAGRYHSWEVNKQNLPETVEVTAVAKNNCIMALQNREKMLYGVQFHPESIMTPDGPAIIKNFIAICKQEIA